MSSVCVSIDFGFYFSLVFEYCLIIIDCLRAGADMIGCLNCLGTGWLELSTLLDEFLDWVWLQ